MDAQQVNGERVSFFADANRDATIPALCVNPSPGRI